MPIQVRRAPGDRGRVGGNIAILLLTLAAVAAGCFKVPTAVSPSPHNFAPRATAEVAPDSGLAPLSVRFTGSASDTDGTIASCRWDFGDGASSSNLAAEHVYDIPGIYSASLSATDNRGATTILSRRIHVKGNRTPSATITASPTSGVAPLAVSFTGVGTDVDSTVVGYLVVVR